MNPATMHRHEPKSYP